MTRTKQSGVVVSHWGMGNTAPSTHEVAECRKPRGRAFACQFTAVTETSFASHLGATLARLLSASRDITILERTRHLVVLRRDRTLHWANLPR